MGNNTSAALTMTTIERSTNTIVRIYTYKLCYRAYEHVMNFFFISSYASR